MCVYIYIERERGTCFLCFVQDYRKSLKKKPTFYTPLLIKFHTLILFLRSTEDEVDFASKIVAWLIYQVISENWKLSKLPIYSKLPLFTASNIMCQSCQDTSISFFFFFFDSRYFICFPQRSWVAEMGVPMCVILQRLHSSLVSNFKLIYWVT